MDCDYLSAPGIHILHATPPLPPTPHPHPPTHTSLSYWVSELPGGAAKTASHFITFREKNNAIDRPSIMFACIAFFNSLNVMKGELER